MKPSRIFALIVALQALFLVGWSLKEETELRKGKEILLEAAPDAESKGHVEHGTFRRLRFKASAIPREMFSGEERTPIEPGSPVYVYLVKEGQYFVPSRASYQKPTDANALYLGGTTAYSFRPRSSKTVAVDYMMDQNLFWRGASEPPSEIQVSVLVLPDGRARVMGLLADGRPLPRE